MELRHLPTAFILPRRFLKIPEKIGFQTRGAHLARYVTYFAFRQGNVKDFHNHLINVWLKALEVVAQVSPSERRKRGEIVGSWFLLETLVKAIIIAPETTDYTKVATLCSKLSEVLNSFTGTGQLIRAVLNRALAYFYKDLLEIAPPSIVLEMIRCQLDSLHLASGRDSEEKAKNSEDRSAFMTFVRCFLTPRFLLFSLAPLPDGTSIFDEIFLPAIEQGFQVPDHTEQFFLVLSDLIRQFDLREQPFVAQRLVSLLRAMGKPHNLSLFKKTWKPTAETSIPDRRSAIHLLAVVHFILYWMDGRDFDQNVGRAVILMNKLARPLSEAEIKMMNDRKATTDTSFTNVFSRSSVVTRSTVGSRNLLASRSTVFHF
jgi:hypothetical protein